MTEFHINPMSDDEFKKYMYDTEELPLVEPVLTRTMSVPINIPPPVKKTRFTNDITIKNEFQNKFEK